MKGDIKKAKKKLSVNKEFEHKLNIAGLQVMTNPKIPNGVMVVSPDEGERLAKMIADATAKAAAKTVAEHAEQLEEEAKANQVTQAKIATMIDAINNAGGNVNKDDYAIYALDYIIFEGELSDYPLEVITVTPDDLPEGVACVVAKKENK